jgi:hypothetical protein
VYSLEGYYNGDIAGLFRRSIMLFRDGGELESAVLDGIVPRTWTAIDWDATVPKSTALAFQVRSSNDPEDLGPWSAEITIPGSLSGILTPDTRYVQYKVIQSTEDPHVSPILREISLEVDGAASVPDAGPDSRSSAGVPVVVLQTPWPNPSPGAATARFTLGSGGFTRIDILDAQGRRLSTPLLGVVTAGTHEVGLPDLANGVYLVRLSSRGSSVAKKLVVK